MPAPSRRSPRRQAVSRGWCTTSPRSGGTGPGLGEWDLRSLVGHTSRSLITVSTYLQHHRRARGHRRPRRSTTCGCDPRRARRRRRPIVERGRQAGRDLGADPAAAVDACVERALGDLADADDPLIAVIGGLGIRLHTYLPTRTFELAVHGLDIARAVGIPFALPADVLDEATVLAARIGGRIGEGETVLLSLTGRTALPPSFSVV